MGIALHMPAVLCHLISEYVIYFAYKHKPYYYYSSKFEMQFYLPQNTKICDIGDVLPTLLPSLVVKKLNVTQQTVGKHKQTRSEYIILLNYQIQLRTTSNTKTE